MNDTLIFTVKDVLMMAAVALTVVGAWVRLEISSAARGAKHEAKLDAVCDRLSRIERTLYNGGHK